MGLKGGIRKHKTGISLIGKEIQTCEGINKGNEVSNLDTDVYLPFTHRDMSNATPDFGALVHMLKCSLGSGILAMPNAFKNGGLIFGLFGTVIVGFICTHCIHLLVYCSQILSVRAKKPSLTFPETSETAFLCGPERLKKFAPFAREFITYSLLLAHYLGNTAYVVFMSTTLQLIMEHHLALGLDIRVYTLMVAVPLIPVASIRSMRYLIPFSILATILIGVGLLMTLYQTFKDLQPLYSRRYMGDIGQLPIFFSTVLFAMEGIGTVLPIENSMKNPNHFIGCPGVLNIAMTVVITLYTVVGFFGYLKFGESTSASITFNLGKTWFSEMVKLIVALSILFSYGLQFTVPSEIVWTKINNRINEKWHTIGYYGMRALLIIGTVLIAIIVPDLGPFISLVGAICFSTLGLTSPSIIDIVTRYNEGYGFCKWRLIKNIIIIVLSLVTLIAGTYSSLLEIIALYKLDSKKV